MNRRSLLKTCLGVCAASIPWRSSPAQAGHPSAGNSHTFDPRSFGAAGDGIAKDTTSIQRAVDAAGAAGGGVVYLAPGVYLAGTIVLRSNVTLHLEAGATLLGSTDLNDYYMPPEPARIINNPNSRHLVFAFNERNVGLTGFGTVDGQSPYFLAEMKTAGPDREDLWHVTRGGHWERKGRVSPMVEFAQCTNVCVENVTLRNAVGWTLRPIGCQSVIIRGVKVYNPDYAPNSDGIDPSSCQNVTISDCNIDTGDDAICIKSDNPYGPNKTSSNIAITNCVLSSACNGFKIGSEGPNGFANIVFSNSVIYSKASKPEDERVISAIDIVMPDGGWIEGVTISNISVRNARVPICIRLQNITDQPQAKMTSWMRSIMISNLQAFGAIVTSSITGIPGFCVEDVTLDNVRVQTLEQGKDRWRHNQVPEREHGYAEGTAFGRLPAFGFYCRHVNGLRIRNTDISSGALDERSMIVCEEVSNLEIAGLSGTPPRSTAETILLRDVRDAALHGNVAPAGTNAFVRVEGTGSRDIDLFANELRRAKQPVACAGNVRRGTVTINGKPLSKDAGCE